MTVSVVQVVTGTGTSDTATFGSPPTAGNTLFVVAQAYSSSAADQVTGITVDGNTLAGTEKIQESVSDTGTDVYQSIWIIPDIPSGLTGVLTASFVDGAAAAVFGYEIAGLGATPQTDQNAYASGAVPDISVSTGDITAAPEIIIGSAIAYGQEAGPPGAGWTYTDTFAGYTYSGYQIASESGNAYTWALTTGGSGVGWAAGIVTVAPAGGATVSLTTPNLALAAPAPAVDSSPRVLLTAPNLALAAPAVSVRADMRVSLTSPNLALAAPPVSPAAGTIVNLTTPGLALAAPAVTPGVNENAAVALTSPNLALAAPAVTPQTSGVTVALTAPGLVLAAPPLIPRGPAILSVQGAPADRQARWAKLRLLGYLP